MRAGSECRQNRGVLVALALAWVWTLSGARAADVVWDDGSTDYSTGDGIDDNNPSPDFLYGSATNWRVNNTLGSPLNDVLPTTLDRANIAFTSGAAGKGVLLTNGVFALNSLRIGVNPGLGLGGNGALTIGDGGALFVTNSAGGTGTGGQLEIGVNNRTGTLVLNSGGSLTVENEIVLPSGGNAQIYIDGGTLSVGGNISATSFRLGNAAGTFGSYALRAGQSISNSGDFYVGNNGSGALVVSNGGGAITANNFYAGARDSSTGTVDFTEGSIVSRTTYLAGVGAGGATGTVATLNLGATGGNPLFITTNNFEVGREGTGTVNHYSGTNRIVLANLVIGQYDGSAGTYALHTGALEVVTGDINLNAGAGTFTINGGSASARAINQSSANGPSTLNLNGGTLTLTGNIDDRGGESTINYNGAQVSVNGGAGFMEAENFNVGTGGNAVLNQVATAAGAGDVAVASNRVDTLSLSSGAGTGTYNVDNGILEIRRGIRDGNADATGSTLTVGNGGTGGILQIQGISALLDTGNQIAGYTQGGDGTLTAVLNHQGVNAIEASAVTVSGFVQISESGVGTSSAADDMASLWTAGSAVWSDATNEWSNGRNPGEWNIGIGDAITVIQAGAGGLIDNGLAISNSPDWSLAVTAGANGRVDVVRQNSATNFGPVKAILAGGGASVSRTNDLNIQNAAGVGSHAAGLVISNGATLALGGASDVNMILGGTAAQGQVDHYGGTVVISSNLVFGQGAATLGGTYQLFGGTLVVSNNIVEGDASGTVDSTVNNAQMHVDGGTLSVVGDIDVQRFAVGQNAGTTGAFVLESNKVLRTSGTFAVGSSGNGAVTVSNGLVAVNDTVIGEAVAGVGALDIHGGSMTNLSNFRVGLNGIGTMNLVDGDVTALAGFDIGLNAGGTGMVFMGTADQSTTPTFTITGAFDTGENGMGTLVVNSGILSQGPAANAFFLGRNNGSDGTMILSNGVVTTLGTFIVASAQGASGRFEMHGGTMTNNNGVRIGDWSTNAVASYVGGNVVIAGGLDVGNSTGSIAAAYLGDGVSSPTMEVGGGNTHIGDSGNGTFVMRSGTFNQLNNNFIVGQNAESWGLFIMSNGVLNAGGGFRIANGGTGIVEHVGGTINVGGTFDMNNRNTDFSDSLYRIRGGTLNVGTNAGDIILGNETFAGSVARFEMLGGEVNANRNVLVGSLQDSQGFMTVSNGTLNVGGVMQVGISGTGRVDQAGGSVTIGQYLEIASGNALAGFGTYRMTGGTLMVGTNPAPNFVYIGNENNAAATAEMEVIGGYVEVSGGIRVANTGGGSGTLTIGDGASSPLVRAGADSTNTTTGNIEVGSGGAGSMVLNSGDFYLVKQNMVVGQAAGSVGSVTVNGGTLNIGYDTNGAQSFASDINFNSGIGSLTQNGGTVNVARSVNLHDNAFSNAVTLALLDGAFNVGQDMNYRTGMSSVTVSNAALSIGRDLLFNAGTGTFEVVGTGGSVSVGRDYTQTAAQTLRFTMDAAGVSSIDVVGAVTLAGVLDTNFNFAAAGITNAFQLGDIVLIDNAGSDAIVGAFDGLTELIQVYDFGDGSGYWLTYQYDAGGGFFNDLALVTVPEPSALVLLLLGGGIGLGVFGRRRR